MCENYNIIAILISDVRFLVGNRSFNVSEDKLMLEAYKELAVFVVSNFEIPISNKSYIVKHFNLNMENLDINTFNILVKLEKKLNSINDSFSLNFPLRALEVYFSFGKPQNIDINLLIKLKFFIAKLHNIVGENYKFD
ncbi:hypothetical protein [Flavobacterium sp. FlaQc-30]|uniref:hypothetical protein n=1 Tax=Flavobacterium sp. FlaQc-30 TaxID=3374179 RepID=UPI0037574D54